MTGCDSHPDVRAAAAHGIHRRIASLARELHNRPAGDADEVIGDLTRHAITDIPGSQYAGITVTTGRRRVETPASTHEYPVLLDKIQQRYLQGPCFAAAANHHPVVRVDDLTTEQRWPEYCRDALTSTPVRSILSFQLFTTQQTMGALNVYAETANAFDDRAEEIGIVYATHTALVWDSVLRENQFRSALASRDIIGQAKGMIMERFDIDALRAFQMLKQLSQEANVPITDIAARIISAEGRSHED